MEVVKAGAFQKTNGKVGWKKKSDKLKKRGKLLRVEDAFSTLLGPVWGMTSLLLYTTSTENHSSLSFFRNFLLCLLFFHKNQQKIFEVGRLFDFFFEE